MIFFQVGAPDESNNQARATPFVKMVYIYMAFIVNSVDRTLYPLLAGQVISDIKENPFMAVEIALIDVIVQY